MALEVEDGTGKSNADSYVSAADATTYHAAYGNAAWAALTDASKEVALRKATRYIDTHYKFRGTKKLSTQALEWPRYDYATDDIDETWPPLRLKNACCELAFLSLTNDLYAVQSDRAITEQTVGPITQKFSSPQFGGQVRFVIVDDMLAPLTAGTTGGTIRLVRGS